MQRIFLVRHGEVDANVEYRYLGRRDDCLNAAGEAQAAALERAFAAQPLAAIYSSPLRRTTDTAAAMARATTAPVRLDERLLEMDFGTWEGLTRAELLAQGEEARRILGAWENDPSVAPPGGESLAAVQTRVLSLVDEICSAGFDRPVALVSHVGPLKALLVAALGLALGETSRLFLDPATISVVDWRDRPVLRLFNGHGHLGWDSARWMG